MLLGSKITRLGLSITEANFVMLAQAWIMRGKRTLFQLDKQFPRQGSGACFERPVKWSRVAFFYTLASTCA